jgi:hypothetical protein
MTQSTFNTSSKPGASKQLSGILKATNTKCHALFIKVMFPTEPSSKDPVKTARAQLIEYFKMVKFVDDDAVLYKWDKNADLGADACIKPSALPTTLTGIQSYANQFWPKSEGGDCWCELHLGFNINPDEFMGELHAQAASRKWWPKNRPCRLPTPRMRVGFFTWDSHTTWSFGPHRSTLGLTKRFTGKKAHNQSLLA